MKYYLSGDRDINMKNGKVSYMMIAHIPASGVKLFEKYEQSVLPLLVEYEGRLERRLQSADSFTEVHLIQFPSTQHFIAYKSDPRRIQYANLLDESGASIQLFEFYDTPINY